MMIMKKLLFTTIALLTGMAAQATNVGDTLVIKDPDKVTIETSDYEQHITVKGANFNSKFSYDQRITIPDTNAVRRTFSSTRDFNKVRLTKCNRKDKKGTVEASGHVWLGMTTQTGAPDGFKHKVGFGEVGFAITADWYPCGSKNSWSIGLGFDWRSYRLKTDAFLYKDADGNIGSQAFDANMGDRYNRIYTFSLQVPFIYTHTFSQKNKWAVSLGAILNFNTGAHLTRGYTVDQLDYEVRTYSIGQRPVTVDFLLSVRTPVLPVYVKYCPMTFFKNDRGPKSHQLSFGIGF